MSQLGISIRERREAFGFSIDAVAQSAALQPDKLQRIEAGLSPTTWELASLADALACDPAQLANGTAEDPRRSVARFRGAEAAAGLTGHDLRLLARGAEAGRILAHLKFKLNEEVSELTAARRVCAPSSATEPWKEGYEFGADARERFQPAGAVQSVQGLLEAKGIHVAAVDFDSRQIEAASLYESGAAPVILLNRRAARFALPLARRAILAHELCHLLHDGGKRDLAVVSRESDKSQLEQRANGFAPSFIAPRTLVLAAVSNAEKSPAALVRNLAMAWGFSFEGAAWHAKNLGLLDPQTVQSLVSGSKPEVTSAFESGLPRTPPDQFGIEAEASPLASGLLSETVIAACAEGVISRGRAAEILSLQ